MKGNLLNLEQCVALHVSNLRSELPDRIKDWAFRAFTSALRSHDWAGTLRSMNIPFCHVVTYRELQLMRVMHSYSKGLDNAPDRRTYYVLDHRDYEDRPWSSWLERALRQGDQLVYCGAVRYRETRNQAEFAAFGPEMRDDENIVCPHEGLNHLCEAVLAMAPANANLNSISIARAFQYSTEWQKELDRKNSLIEGQVQLVYSEVLVSNTHDEKPQLYHIVRLLDKRSTEREGYVMHHCVGSYTPTDKKRLYSIRRDEISGPSEATAEILVGSNDSMALIQIKGPNNTNPDPKLSNLLKEYLHRTYPSSGIRDSWNLPEQVWGAIDILGRGMPMWDGIHPMIRDPGIPGVRTLVDARMPIGFRQFGDMDTTQYCVEGESISAGVLSAGIPVPGSEHSMVFRAGDIVPVPRTRVVPSESLPAGMEELIISMLRRRGNQIT